MKEKINKMIELLQNVRKEMYGQPGTEESYGLLGRAMSSLIDARKKLETKES